MARFKKKEEAKTALDAGYANFSKELISSEMNENEDIKDVALKGVEEAKKGTAGRMEVLA